MARTGPGEAGGRPGNAADAGVGDGRRGAGRSMPKRCLVRPPSACPAASALLDCRPLPLSSRVPWLRRADSRRRAGPAGPRRGVGGGGLRRPEAGRAVGAERVTESNGSGRTAAGASRARTRRCIPKPPWTTSTRRQEASPLLKSAVLTRCGSRACSTRRRRSSACARSLSASRWRRRRRSGRPKRWLARRIPIRRTARSWGDGRRPCPARGVAGVRAAWRGALAVAGLSDPRFGAWRAWRVCGTGDRRGDRPGSSAGGSDKRYRGATRGWSSCSERPTPLGVASTMGSRQAWGRTGSRMMRGAAFRPLLRTRPQIMWVGLPAWGRQWQQPAQGFTECSPAVESARGAGVRAGVLGGLSPFRKRWANVQHRTMFWKWSAK